MIYVVCLVAMLSCVWASPLVDLNAALHIQTDIDQGKPIEHVFRQFKKVHGKVYASEFDEKMRQAIFEDNVKHITEHNKLYSQGEKSYFLGANQFADLTHTEFVKLYTGHILKSSRVSNATTYLSPANLLIKDNVDWRDHGYVTPVKNQGQCGSCWSFSATGSLEGQNYKKKGKLVSLSEQQLVDCSGKYGNEGCNGGLMDEAFEYIKAVGGIDSEDDYPYTAEQEDTCKYEKSKEVAEVSGYVDVTSGDEDKLKEAVGSVGPVSIAIDASHRSFQLYSGGVYTEPECSSSELDHGVLVVGYGDSPSDYWLVKNSWGTTWGEEGYIKMARNQENQCGVATQASYPLV